MKNIIVKSVFALLVALFCASVASASNPAEGLDLYAMAELLKNSDNLEKFEQALNDPETGVNNLDLNEDDAVDFVSVSEQVAGDTHLVVLQTPLGENESQDVATIAMEKDSGKYNLQIQGDEMIYGANYYVVPANNEFSDWNIVRWIFRPDYRPYVSTYSYRVLPRWWKTRRPLALNVYRTRAGAFAGRRNFVASRTVTVRTINKINYRPRAATVVTRRTTVTRTTNGRGSNNQNNTQTVTKTKVVKRKRN